jgi:hypothetical protein
VANTNSPFGFQRYQSGAGAGPTFAMTRRRIASSYTTALYSGDPVQPVVTTANGYIIQGSASTTVLAGVLWGVEFLSTTAGNKVWRNYWPGSGASGDVFAYVIDDPQARFRVQGNSTTFNITGSSSAGGGGTWTTSPVGQYAQYSQGTGSVNGGYGQSGAYLNTLGTTVTLPFIVTDLITDPPGTNGADPTTAFNHVVVGFNNEWMRNNGAGPTGIS